MFKIALSTHLFVYHVLDERIIGLIAKAGFKYVELWAMRPHLDYHEPRRLSEIAAALRRARVRVCALHAPFYAHVEDALAGKWLSLAHGEEAGRLMAMEETRRAMDALACFDCPLLVLHPAGVKEEETPQSRGRLAAALRTLLDYGAPRGIFIALENIPAPAGSPRRVLSLIEELARPNLGFCLDIGHAWLRGALPGVIEASSPHLLHIHGSDNDGLADLHRPPGEGTVPWDEVERRLSMIAYKGFFSWELRFPENPPSILSKIYVKSGEIFPLALH